MKWLVSSARRNTKRSYQDEEMSGDWCLHFIGSWYSLFDVTDGCDFVSLVPAVELVVVYEEDRWFNMPAL